MKETAKASYLKTLSKEDLDIDLSTLSDKELKKLYVIWQKLRQHHFPYRAIKKADFEETLVNGSLQYVSFKGVEGLRPLTLKEYLRFEEFVKENPHMYRSFSPLF